MAAITASVGVRALASPQRPPQPSTSGMRPIVRCKALSFPSQPQLSSFTTTRQGPSCPWPAPESANSHASASPSGVWAFLPTTSAEAQQPASTLPPEVERLMRFTDGPGAAPAGSEQQGGILSWWRYQGP